LAAKGADRRADSLAAGVDVLHASEDLRAAVHAKDVLQAAGKPVAGKDRVDSHGAGFDFDVPSAQKLGRNDRAARSGIQRVNRNLGADGGPIDHLSRFNHRSNAQADLAATKKHIHFWKICGLEREIPKLGAD
jgi:hypothetical protein